MDPFLETILMSSAFRAATGQGKGTHIYRSKKAGETKKNYAEKTHAFRTAFRGRIKEECRSYRSDNANEAKWKELIELICSDFSASHADVLYNKRLRIGTAQKMLSLALKLYWKSGEDNKKPFWPPLDAQVIKAARRGLEKDDRGISWKKLDDMEQYVRMMREIEDFARTNGYTDACDWEYDVWQTNDEL